MSDLTQQQLRLRRAVLLYGPISIPAGSAAKKNLELSGIRGELTFVVGVADDPNRPVMHVETMNLVFDASDELGGGGGTPSASLNPDTLPPVELDPRSGEVSSRFDLNLDIPAARAERETEPDPENHAPDPQTQPASVELTGRFRTELRPREYGQQVLDLSVRISPPEAWVEQRFIPEIIEFETVVVLVWLTIRPRRQLMIQPVFISPHGTTPSTGADFYPGLARANELWGRCCIQFVAKCPPIYVDEQAYRIATAAEATAFKNQVDVADAIEVFMVERLDPESTWGGGATWGGGTAGAKVVSGDNQLPLNRNHMAHELGHVLGLCHPGVGCTGNRADGCNGSLMEPSGFFADNPDFQCEANCTNAVNPLLCTVPFQTCVTRPLVNPAPEITTATQLF
jgi:hypothetical protein